RPWIGDEFRWDWPRYTSEVELKLRSIRHRLRRNLDRARWPDGRIRSRAAGYRRAAMRGSGVPAPTSLARPDLASVELRWRSAPSRSVLPAKCQLSSWRRRFRPQRDLSVSDHKSPPKDGHQLRH